MVLEIYLFIYFKVVTNYQRNTILLLKAADCKLQRSTDSDKKQQQKGLGRGPGGGGTCGFD